MGPAERIRRLSKPAEIAGSLLLAGSAIGAVCSPGESNKQTDKSLPIYEDSLPEATVSLEVTAVPMSVSDEAPDYAKLGELAPDPGLVDVNGQEVKLESYRGKVVLLFNYFRRFGASQKDLDDLLQIRAIPQYRDKVEILTMVESVDLGRDLLSKTSPVLVIGDDQGDLEKLQSKYPIQGYPVTVLIDENGILVDIQMGRIDEDFKNKIHAEISR